MTRLGTAVSQVTAALLVGCTAEGVEPPALRVMRFQAEWPCSAGDSGRHDLTLNEVEVSGEPTMYDLVITCAPGDSVGAVVVERGRWSVLRDSNGAEGAQMVELYAGDGLRLARYRRLGSDTLIPLDADGAPHLPVLSRVVVKP